MTGRRFFLVLLVVIAVCVYAIPAFRSERVFWFAPDYHPEYYNETAFPFTGYAYPVLPLLLFVLAAAQHAVGSPRFPGLVGSIAEPWSQFILLFPGVISVLFMIWLAVTPVF